MGLSALCSSVCSSIYRGVKSLFCTPWQERNFWSKLGLFAGWFIVGGVVSGGVAVGIEYVFPGSGLFGSGTLLLSNYGKIFGLAGLLGGAFVDAVLLLGYGCCYRGICKSACFNAPYNLENVVMDDMRQHDTDQSQYTILMTGMFLNTQESYTLVIRGHTEEELGSLRTELPSGNLELTTMIEPFRSMLLCMAKRDYERGISYYYDFVTESRRYQSNHQGKDYKDEAKVRIVSSVEVVDERNNSFKILEHKTVTFKELCEIAKEKRDEFVKRWNLSSAETPASPLRPTQNAYSSSSSSNVYSVTSGVHVLYSSSSSASHATSLCVTTDTTQGAVTTSSTDSLLSVSSNGSTCPNYHSIPW